MKKTVTQREADELLNEFVRLRDKAKRSKSKKILAEYKRLQELCIQKFDYLVISKTQKYKNFSNYEDLKQDGRVALLSALKTYHPKEGSFFWWANQYIGTKVKREANRHSTIKIPLKKAKNLLPYKVSEMPIIIDSAFDPLTSLENDQIKICVKDAINSLPETQRKIINLYYEFIGITPYNSINKISEELNISRLNCIKLLDEAKENLKNHLKHLFV